VNLFSGSLDYTSINAFKGAVVSIKRKTFVVLALAASVLGIVVSAPVAASNSPFTALSGSWSGKGTITLASGSREQIRCLAKYAVDGSGDKLDLRLRCAGDSFKFELQSNVAHSNGTLTGNWAELTRHVGGNIDGSAIGNKLKVRVSGTIAALLAVSTNANMQQISIEAPGSDLSQVAISLSRGSK
jgi:hypothetical protein